MYISSVVKFRTTSERDAALALEKAVKGVGKDTSGTIEDIRSGFERASWYSSCFFDKYASVCTELKNEDARFIKSIFEIYNRRDIIADMLRMYLEEELNSSGITKVQYIDMKLTEVLSNYSGGRLTKVAMANTLSVLIVNSFHFKNEILLQVNKSSLAIVTAASFYGKVQLAALSARRLRQLSPRLYQTLYSNNMEMLYFLISDKIDKALLNSMGLRGDNRFISIIRSLAG